MVFTRSVFMKTLKPASSPNIFFTFLYGCISALVLCGSIGTHAYAHIGKESGKKSSEEKGAQYTARQTQTFKVSYADYRYSDDEQAVPEYVGKTYDFTNLTFSFATVEGRVFGNITGRTLVEKSPTHAGQFSFELPKWIDAPFIDMPKLTITTDIPSRQPRFARLSTLHFDKTDPEATGAGMVDKKTNNYLLLVYVSEPTRLTGRSWADGYIYRYDVHFASSGWHWLSVQRLSPKVANVRLANAQNIEPELQIIRRPKDIF